VGKTKIEERGRILIPKKIRDLAGIRPGEEVEVDFENGKVVIRPLFDVKRFSSELRGCISESDIHPLEVKKIWK
jgi:AbrB family looped-hinge helix DNA binding protein